MTFDPLTLHAFLIIAETGSFTKASKTVGRTQSAISQQIAKLEKSIDRTLFKRGSRVTLTPEGEIFLAYAKQVLELHQELLDRFKEPQLQGEVRFGLPEDFASIYLTDVLVEYSRIHPRIVLNVECDLTVNLYQKFRQGEYDLVLVKMNRPEDFPNGHFIWSEDLVWVYDGGPVDDSKPVPLVLAPQPCIYRSRAIQTLESAGKHWRLAFTSTSYAGTTGATKAGIGLTVLPRTLVPSQLKILENDELPSLGKVHVSLLKQSSDNFAINSFESFVLNRLFPGHQ
ncbi:MAG: LysR family transcriptional regulator [Chlamydiota bacterium]